MINIMDSERTKREAQEQIDRALAEVDRLKGVAKEIEEANKKANVNYEKNSQIIKEDIARLEQEKLEAKEMAAKAKVEFTEAFEEKRLILAEINARREDLGKLNHLAVEKKDELAEIEVTKARQVARFENLIEVKSQELRDVEAKIQRQILAGVEEKAILDNTLATLQSRIVKSEEVIKQQKEESERVLAVTKKLQSDAAYAELQKEKAESDLKAIELQKTEITQEIEEKNACLEKTKEELIKVQTELVPLEAKRIASIAFMEDLKNKESNLRAKYEKVGMVFPE